VAGAVAAAALVLSAACSGDEPSSAPGDVERASRAESVVATEPSQSDPTAESLPEPVAQTRAAILAAANAQDYDALAPLIDAQSFLSDAGFGAEPLERWQDQGSGPLEAMTTLLAMPHAVRETNEGTLYQWPRFTADSDPADMSAAEKEALSRLLGERMLDATFLTETGYVAPRLGIRSDGTWWFLVLEPTP
jgi:hypothetical protein